MRLLIYFLILNVGAARASDDATLVSRFLQYKKLPCITKKKIDMEQSVAVDCRDPKLIHGPHIKPGILIYANDVTIEERKKNPESHKFPIGALLVKEKFENKKDAQPSTITVMEKIANQGKVEDWQFYMIRIADRSIVRDEFKVSCMDCHSHYAKSDFVSSTTDSLLSEFAGQK